MLSIIIRVNITFISFSCKSTWWSVQMFQVSHQLDILQFDIVHHQWHDISSDKKKKCFWTLLYIVFNFIFCCDNNWEQIHLMDVHHCHWFDLHVQVDDLGNSHWLMLLFVEYKSNAFVVTTWKEVLLDIVVHCVQFHLLMWQQLGIQNLHVVYHCHWNICMCRWIIWRIYIDWRCCLSNANQLHLLWQDEKKCFWTLLYIMFNYIFRMFNWEFNICKMFIIVID